MEESEDIKELRKELQKLKPKDRIEKLKELEKKTKEDTKTKISAIEDLIKDSEKDLRTETVAESIAPEPLEVDIGKLFREGEEKLERTVRKEAKSKTEDRGYMALQQIYGDYSKLKDIAYASMMGPLSHSQMEVVDQIGEKLDKSKYHSASQEVANILVASRAVLYKIRRYAGLE